MFVSVSYQVCNQLLFIGEITWGCHWWDYLGLLLDVGQSRNWGPCGYFRLLIQQIFMLLLWVDKFLFKQIKLHFTPIWPPGGKDSGSNRNWPILPVKMWNLCFWCLCIIFRHFVPMLSMKLSLNILYYESMAWNSVHQLPQCPGATQPKFNF